MKQGPLLSVVVFVMGLTVLLFVAAVQSSMGQEIADTPLRQAIRRIDPGNPDFNLKEARDLFQKLKIADSKDESAAAWVGLIDRLMAAEAEIKRLASEKKEVENTLDEKRKIITILLDQIQQMKEIDLAMEKQKREANSIE